MTRSEFETIMELATDIGIDAAWWHYQEAITAKEHEAELEGRAAEDFEDRAYGRDGAYRYGCGEYDTVDSKGRKLRSLYNDAGEWRGM